MREGGVLVPVFLNKVLVKKEGRVTGGGSKTCVSNKGIIGREGGAQLQVQIHVFLMV